MMNTGAVSYEFRLSLDREISTAAVFIRKIRKLSHMSYDIGSNATHSLIPKRASCTLTEDFAWGYLLKYLHISIDETEE
ncbi:hypothetical protein D917_09213 [Trichinella nativa]|uniref:Uncharacterized protein n=1 Tax=Trichinella nativa TaxID=6335 RepID=A0A1Y3EL91_9BILA|nr:hypothetical protein D917_09213 [Trichinella nativa]